MPLPAVITQTDASGNMTLTGSAGNDALFDGVGNDLLIGAGGNDLLLTRDGFDTLLGGDGDDTLQAVGANTAPAVIDGGAGNDRISVWTTANVSVTGGEGRDTFDFGYATPNAAYVITDFTAGPQGDVLDLGALLETLSAETHYTGRNPFSSEQTYFRLVQNGSATEVQIDYDSATGTKSQFQTVFILLNTSAASLTADNFALGLRPDGADMVTAPQQGGEASESLTGTLFRDTLLGAGGKDSLFGQAGSDWLDGGDGDDVLSGGNGDDTLVGGAGNDVLSAGAGNNQLDGGSGDDVLYARNGGNNTMLGGEGDDSLAASNSTEVGGNLLLDGGAGNDTLQAYTGGATAGNRAVLHGGSGRDTFVATTFNGGEVVVDDFAAGAGGDIIDINTVLGYTSAAIGNPFSAGSPMRLEQDGADVLLRMLQYQYGGPAVWQTLLRLTNTSLAALSADNFTHHVDPTGVSSRGELVNGTDGADNLTGWYMDDTLDGGAGNDYLSGGGGADSLIGGDGDDTLIGNDKDTLLGGDGNDRLHVGDANAGAGTSIADGGAGDDFIFVDNSGGAVLAVTGGAGRDTFTPDGTAQGAHITDFAAGSGGDLINLDVLLDAIRWYVGGNPYTQGTLRLLQQGEDTLLQVATNQAATAYTTVLVLEKVAASTLTSENFVNHIDPQGTATAGMVLTAGNGGENLSGGSFNDTLNGGTGNDTLHGYGGDDLIRAHSDGAHGALVYGDYGNDSLGGGDGRDTLDGGQGNDSLDGGAGNDLLVYQAECGDDTLAGGSGDDQFNLKVNGNEQVRADGGSGDDVFVFAGAYATTGALALHGGAGSDIYRPDNSGTAAVVVDDFAAGTGGDVIDLTRLMLYSGASWLGYLGGNPFALGYVRLVQQGEDTLFEYDADSGATGADLRSFVTLLTLKNVQASTLTAANFTLTLDGLVRAVAPDGSGVSGASYVASGSSSYHGSSFNDTLAGSKGNDSLYGAGGDDLLSSKRGSNGLYGESGNDTLQGGSGADTLDGGSGDDWLISGSGNNVLKGGFGSDLYQLYSAGSTVIETDNDYRDGDVNTIQIWYATDSYTLGYGIANLKLMTTANTSLIGNGWNNLLTGNAANNVLVGGRGYDTLDGGGGNDTMSGGEDDDTYIVDSLGDVVIEQAFDGFSDQIQTSLASYTLPQYVEKLIYTGSGAFVGRGNAFSNLIQGGSGRNELYGGDGHDTLVVGNGAAGGYIDGGSGIDGLKGLNNLADYSVTLKAGGDIVLQDRASHTMLTVSAVELLYFKDGTRSASAIVQGAGTSANDYLEGTAGNDTLDGVVGEDAMAGGAGDDVYRVNSSDDLVIEASGGGNDTVNVALPQGSTYRLPDEVENAFVVAGGTIALNLTGNALDNALTGNAASNILVGGAGNDTLDGGSGADKLQGGLGDDTYVIRDTAAVITENGGEGSDTVRTALANYTLGANIENLSYSGTALFTGTGNALDNVITGGAAGNKLDGGAGNDELHGGAGADSLLGGSGSDILYASAGKDTVDGSDGEDVLRGLGNYTDYTVSRPVATDTVLTDKAGNVLTVRNVEWFAFADGNKSLAETLYNVATGAGDVLSGTDGNDTLNGGAGADTMAGGLGNDTYVVDNAGDVVREAEGGGLDLVQVAYTAAATYRLGDFIENATVTAAAGVAVNLTGNDGDNALSGNAAANTLLGGAGNDTLDGGAGADRLGGGLGDDLYVVDNAGDVVTESSDQGTDSVLTTLASYVLAANVERLRYTGSAAFSGSGNALDNVLVGGSGSNKLDGGAGNDVLAGGSGSDSLLGGAGADTLEAGTGKDTIDGGADQDVLQLAGNFADYSISRPNASDTVLTDKGGNVLTVRNVEQYAFADGSRGLGEVQYNVASVAADLLSGTDGNDTMNGLAGADTMAGGLGDDAYVVDNLADLIVEGPGAAAGLDVALVALTAAGTYQLAANVENATVTAAAGVAVSLSGNDGDNRLTGNAAANTLSGGAGNDTLDGGAGNDKLIGGAGDDTYLVADSGDTVTEAADGGHDTVQTTLASYTLAANVENLGYTGKVAFSGTGNALDNVITGSVSAANRLDGGAGNDTLTGGSGNDSLAGGLGDDYLVGGGGKDTIDGGAGNDTVVGLGDFGSYTVKRSNATDTVLTDSHGMAITLRGVESVAFADGVKTINEIQGNVATSYNDSLHGTDAADLMNGGAGIDTLAGGLGDDTYVVANAASLVIEDADAGTDLVRVALTAAGTYVLTANVENATVTAAAGIAVNLTGNAFDNVLIGNAAANSLLGGAGNDTLNGGAGADVLKGGAGDDVYVVGESGDTVSELAGEGSDTVLVSLSKFTLGANVENLAYTGSGNFSGTGNALDNILIGGAGNDSLQGGAGNDHLQAGLGKDTVDGGAGDDVLQGLDKLEYYTLARPNSTDLVLTRYDGSAITVRNVESFEFADGVRSLAQLQANSASGGNDLIYGSRNGEILDGGLGVDTLVGGAGGDTYVLRNPLDVVMEETGGGMDLVQLAFTKAASYVLPDNVENAEVTATAGIAVNVTGNDLDNWITGNGAANTLSGGAGIDRLDGGAGADTLIGGTGTDIYVVDNAGDKVIENPDEGANDYVQTTLASYTLGANLEILEYTGSASFTGIGNELNNKLMANYARNARIDGGAGDDGISGSDGNDVLLGGTGDDSLAGGTGSDTLTGGAGADVFHVDKSTGVDTVTDFQSGVDHLRVNVTSLNGDHYMQDLSNALVRNAPGSFVAQAGLVIFTQRMAADSASNAAAIIGSASSAFNAGETALFVVSTAKDTMLYQFQSQGSDALVSAAELTKLAVLTGTPTVSLADFQMYY